MLADMLSHFLGSSNAVQGADPSFLNRILLDLQASAGVKALHICPHFERLFSIKKEDLVLCLLKLTEYNMEQQRCYAWSNLLLLASLEERRAYKKAGYLLCTYAVGQYSSVDGYVKEIAPDLPTVGIFQPREFQE